MEKFFRKKNKFSKLYTLLLSILTSICVGNAAEETEKDPCFFRLTLNDSRKIYVLGGIHVLKIEESLSPQALDEFKRIAKEEKPILYTEHELKNKDAFEIIKDRNGLKSARNWAKNVIKIEHKSMLDDKVLIEPGHPSGLTIRDILEIEPWLAAPILSCHTNSLFYPNFGGTEYNLETDEEWKHCWSEISYLEGPKHYELLEGSSQPDQEHNIKWIEGSFYKLLMINSILKEPTEYNDEIEILVLKAEKENSLFSIQKLLNEMKKRYSNKGWEVVNFEDVHLIPQSVFLRNEHWAETIESKLSKINMEEHPNPLLLVCGDGHLAGISKDKSFLSYLMQKTNPSAVERFINVSKTWKSVR